MKMMNKMGPMTLTELTGRHDDQRMKSAGESDECETTRNSLEDLGRLHNSVTLSLCYPYVMAIKHDLFRSFFLPGTSLPSLQGL